MPVVVQCFHCSHVLELDDGFRGGVCRCSQCGALLHVPKGDAPAPRAARAAAPVPRPVGKKNTASGVDIGISSGRLDPRNAPIAHYRGAADPGLSSGSLSLPPSGSLAPPTALASSTSRRTAEELAKAATLDAQVAIKTSEPAEAGAQPLGFYIWGGVLLALVVIAAIAIALTVGL